MTPWEQMEAVYDEARAESPDQFPLTFGEMFAFHARHYFAFSTPNYILYGRPVIKGADESFVCDPVYAFDPVQCDTWFIHGLAGDTSLAWKSLPYELPWIAMERISKWRTPLRYYRVSTIRRLLPLFL